MNSSTQQVVTLYEISGVSPEDIASELELDPLAVKSVLAQFSMLYRDRLREEEKRENNNKALTPGQNEVVEKPMFSEDEMQVAIQAVSTIVQTTEDDNVRLRAAKFIINENKGRHDMKKLKGTNLNIILINEHIQKARAAIERAKANNRVIDIEPLQIQESK